MSRFQFIAHAGAAVLICALALVVTRGQEPQAEATGPGGPTASLESVPTASTPQGDAAAAQVVLLHNGRVLEGRTRKEGDTYVVERPAGEIRLSASSVKMVAHSREGLYARCRTEMLPDDVEGHLALAQWCLRQDLLAEARLELAAAMALSPDSPVAGRLLIQVERRERGESEPGDDPEEDEGALSDPSAADGQLFAPGATGRSAEAGANGETAEQEETSESQAGPPYAWPTMPEHALAEFRRTVQPLLVNSCTTGGCHNSTQSSGFGMIRIQDPRLLTPETTTQNLRAVLAWIDPSNPDNSELLAMSVLAHARGPNKQFKGLRGRQFDALARWISSLEQAPRRSQRTASRSGQAAAFRTAMDADAAAPGRRGSNAGRRLPSRRARSAGLASGPRARTKETEAAKPRTEPEPALAEEPAREPRAERGKQGFEELPQGPMSRPGQPRLQNRSTEPITTLGQPGDDSGTIPDAAALGAPPRVANYAERSSAGGGDLSGVMSKTEGAQRQKPSLSGFLRRLNPFRRRDK